jgi:hypothetical protein
LILKNLEIMNLQNLNLVELNAQEVQDVDGGMIEPVEWFLAALAIGAAVDWAAGEVMKGWNQPR